MQVRAQTWDVAREFLFLRDSLRGENRGGVASKRKIKKKCPNGQRKKKTGAQTDTFAAQTATFAAQTDTFTAQTDILLKRVKKCPNG